MGKPQDTTGNYCATHDRHYSKLEQCADCRASAGIQVRTSSPKADTTRLRTVAARYRLNEMAMWDAAKQTWLDDPHATAKFSTESGKWATRADELEAKIVELEHDQWLIEQKRLLGGGGN